MSRRLDPARSRDWSDYGQVTLIKANWLEATEAASCEHPRPLALARKLADAHNCDVVITLGRHGMVCAEPSGAAWHLPATPSSLPSGDGGDGKAGGEGGNCFGRVSDILRGEIAD